MICAGYTTSMKKFFAWWIFALVAIVPTVLFCLRFYHLSTFPIFVDEAIYVRWAQVMKAESTLRFLPMSDGKQPLFMWVVIPFLKFISDPLVAGRLVSVFCGLGTFIGIGVLAYFLFRSKKVILLAITLYAISPYSMFFDRMALADSMLSMFGVWTFIGAFWLVKTLRLDVAMLTGFALGGAWLTKSPALFFTLLLPTVWLFLDLKKKRFVVISKTLMLFGVVWLISQAMFNILRLGPNFHMLSSRNFDYVYPINSILSTPLDPLVPHLHDVGSWLSSLGPGTIVVFLVGGFLIGIKKYKKETLFLSALILVPVLAQCIYAKVFTARYLFFVFPYLVILSSMVALSIRKIVWVLLAIFLGLYSYTSLKQDYYLLTNPERMVLPIGERSGYLEEWSAGQGIYETAGYLKEVFKTLADGSQIVVGTDGYFGTLPEGLQIYLNNYPQIIITGVEVSFIEVPQALKDSFAAGNKTYLLVNSSRFFIKDPKADGLQLIKSYPRAQKADGEIQQLLLFELIH